MAPGRRRLADRIDHEVPAAAATAVLTARLELRLPVEEDRARFVRLFCDEAFMVFSAGVLDRQAASQRFDRMLLRGHEIFFAKQPIIERATGETVGYCGVDCFEFEGKSRLEFGYRLVPAARGKGFATEAGRALLDEAAESFRGEILAIIDPHNHASQNVADKLGFQYWKQPVVNGHLVNLYRIELS
ncbi:MAG: GNAT family N-acetyltransferase [Acidimicrobiales bacterium]